MAGPTTTSTLIKGHVIDASQGLNGMSQVLVHDGKIAAIGDAISAPADAAVVDATGQYVTPGWIDIHVHAYGTLGFSDPDSIGVYQGVTSFIDAGGAGIGVMDEFHALMDDLVTDIYAGPFVRPLGLIGLNFKEGDPRSLGDLSIAKWLDYVKGNADTLRYLKCNAMGDFGPGSLKIAKGLAQMAGVPLYMHIGEFQKHMPKEPLSTEAFKVASAGDLITHIYHGNQGGVLDDDGQVLQIVRDAEQRGVLFDLGFGGYNFSWDVAEKAFAQGIVPHIISSDLQQFNVVTPVKSLANCMSAMMRLGMDLPEVVARVTDIPARAMSLSERAGSLKVGMPADITVFQVQDGDFEFSDCHSRTRSGTRQIVPTLTFKDGRVFEADMHRAQNESNWFLQFAEDHVPAAAMQLGRAELRFLAELALALKDIDWRLEYDQQLDVDKAIELQSLFQSVRKRCGLPLKAALLAVFNCFVDQRFTFQIGLFLMCLDRPLVLRRLADVTRRAVEVA